MNELYKRIIRKLGLVTYEEFQARGSELQTKLRHFQSVNSEKIREFGELATTGHEINKELDQMRLRIDNFITSTNLKFEQLTKVPLEKHEPISLRHKPMRVILKERERASFERSIQRKAEIDSDLERNHASIS